MKNHGIKVRVAQYGGGGQMIEGRLYNVIGIQPLLKIRFGYTS